MLTLNFAWIGLFLLLCIIAFLIHNGFNINLFVRKDEYITEKFLDKFPLVTSEFLDKTQKEQTIENNQEIHEINKRLDKIEFYLNSLNKQQSITLTEVKEWKNL